nr:unnamed protein product [Callosobruchus chinensis]
MVLCVETGNDGIPFIQLGSYQMRLDLEELTGEDKDRAVEELKETPENVQEGLRHLKELIEADKELHVPHNNDAYLTKFLRPCRWNAEHAYKIMRKFYKFKVKHPKYGINITPHCVRHVFDHEVFRFLPSRATGGARVMIMNVGTKWNPKVVKLEDMFRAVMVAIEIAMLEPKTQLGGVHVILDMSGLSLVHIYQFSPQLAKLILDWVQECAPTRLKGIHVINQSFIFDVLYKMFKPFLGEKIKKCLYFHGDNRKTLTEKLSAEALTEYYGGTADIPEFPGSLFADMLFYYENEFQGNSI